MDYEPTLKKSGDLDDMPRSQLDYKCGKCGLPAPIEESECLHYDDALGYRWYRIRMIVKCEECGERTTYRMACQVIHNGKLIHKDEKND